MPGCRGEGCKNCLVAKGVISPEECIGCDGKRAANHDYFPHLYNYDGSRKDKEEEPRKTERR